MDQTVIGIAITFSTYAAIAYIVFLILLFSGLDPDHYEDFIALLFICGLWPILVPLIIIIKIILFFTKKLSKFHEKIIRLGRKARNN